MKYFIETDNILTAKFEFIDFRQALEFVNLIGEVAEKNKHHPDILLHNYKYVSIEITTHDYNNTVTEKDFKLAELIEEIHKNKYE